MILAVAVAAVALLALAEELDVPAPEEAEELGVDEGAFQTQDALKLYVRQVGGGPLLTAW